MNSSEEYMLGKEVATRLIHEVVAAVKGSKSWAVRMGIARREMELFGGKLSAISSYNSF